MPGHGTRWHKEHKDQFWCWVCYRAVSKANWVNHTKTMSHQKKMKRSS
jgi:hypothetical protein